MYARLSEAVPRAFADNGCVLVCSSCSGQLRQPLPGRPRPSVVPSSVARPSEAIRCEAVRCEAVRCAVRCEAVRPAMAPRRATIKKQVANEEQVQSFVDSVSAQAEEITMSRIKDYISKNPSLGPRILALLDGGYFENKPASSEEKLKAQQNKFSLIPKEHLKTILRQMKVGLSDEQLDVLKADDLVGLLSFGIGVEASSALPSLGVKSLSNLVAARYLELGGQRLQQVPLLPSGKVDWSKIGAFRVVMKGGKAHIRHEASGNEIVVPTELSGSDLVLSRNSSETKAKIGTDLVSIMVQRIFSKGGILLPAPLQHADRKELRFLFGGRWAPPGFSVTLCGKFVHACQS